ncbi:response regulator transcription factor [Crassaminicella profunda]|uniref:response regulator transcription factor n=1 Tax=Crassaminicella profunda TaxID=1286698 RepID=UPI001CA7986E|nr:response regulator [Crassaminicella profunda]QZY54146.1 response regulator [Crassaminicella profunda]
MHRLLIVEDEELERKALKMIIEKDLQDTIEIVGETGSGLEAVELAEKLKPHFILMDIKVYGMNGIEASERIKKRNPNIAILILTAYDEFDLAHKAIKAHVDDYILKPARPSRIIESIRNQMKQMKTDDVDIVSMMNELKITIQKVDYKNSKYMLKGMIKHIFDTYENDTQSIVKNLKEVIDHLLHMALDLGIYNHKNIEVYKGQYKNNFDVFCNQYKAQGNLIEILDLIFNELLRSKKNIYQNDIKRILDYIEKNCKKNITLEEVAEFGSISPYYLSKLFKKKVGINFSTYIVNKKMEMAKELLENTDMPIINIALELSYNEPNYFSKVFKKITGVTPTEYRNSEKNIIEENILKKNTFVINGKWSI